LLIEFLFFQPALKYQLHFIGFSISPNFKTLLILSSTQDHLPQPSIFAFTQTDQTVLHQSLQMVVELQCSKSIVINLEMLNFINYDRNFRNTFA